MGALQGRRWAQMCVRATEASGVAGGKLSHARCASGFANACAAEDVGTWGGVDVWMSVQQRQQQGVQAAGRRTHDARRVSPVRAQRETWGGVDVWMCVQQQQGNRRALRHLPASRRFFSAAAVAAVSAALRADSCEPAAIAASTSATAAGSSPSEAAGEVQQQDSAHVFLVCARECMCARPRPPTSVASRARARGAALGKRRLLLLAPSRGGSSGGSSGRSDASAVLLAGAQPLERGRVCLQLLVADDSLCCLVRCERPACVAAALGVYGGLWWFMRVLGEGWLLQGVCGLVCSASVSARTHTR
jgi:hypothetical protein